MYKLIFDGRDFVHNYGENQGGHRADLVSHFSPGSDLVVNKGYPRRDFEALTANY
jgi:hypothetical protein